MEASASQSRGSRRRCRNDPSYRTTRRRGVFGGNPSSTARRPISSTPGKETIHTERAREAAAVGDTDGAGPSGADGGEDRNRADLLAGLPTLQLSISPQEYRDTTLRCYPNGG